MTGRHRSESMTVVGRSIPCSVNQEVREGRFREEEIAAEVVGLARPLPIFRSTRKTSLIAYDWHGDGETFCPPMWWDLVIGSGACGLVRALGSTRQQTEQRKEVPGCHA